MPWYAHSRDHEITHSRVCAASARVTRTDRQTNRRTDGRTDGRADRKTDTLVFCARGSCLVADALWGDGYGGALGWWAKEEGGGVRVWSEG